MYIHVPTALIVVLFIVVFAVSDYHIKRDDARRVKSGELSGR